MNTVISVLEGFEKLAYKFLLSIIFIPKTIVRVTVDPGTVPEYIQGELKKEKGAFDEYMSPILLLLVVALIPTVFINFLPTFGTKIVGKLVDGEPPTTRRLQFEAETHAKSGSSDIYYRYSWFIEKIVEWDDKGHPTNYVEIYRETYDEETKKITIILEGTPVSEFDGEMFTTIEYPNQNFNTSKNTFFYEFSEKEEGQYFVNVEVTSFDPAVKDKPPLENYFAYLYMSVPPLPEPGLPVPTTAQIGDQPIQESTPQIFIGEQATRAKEKQPGNINLGDLLKKETTIFLALGLLFPPLLFALASRLFRGEKIGENFLRESFYAQCYYFSPLSLAIWATYYAWFFFTPDIFSYKSAVASLQILLLPSALAVLWFISTQTRVIAQERQIKEWVAFTIVIVCISILLLAGALVFSYLQPYSPVPELLRTSTIFVYPFASGMLLMVIGIAWFNRRRAQNKKFTVRDITVVAMPLLMAVCAAGLISVIMNPLSNAPITSTPNADTPQPVALEIEPSPTVLPTSTQPPPPTETAVIPTEPTLQRFYTEEFDTNDNPWTYFAVDGGTSTITKADNPKMSLLTENNLLTFDINAMNLWVYAINDSFEYDNVRVDARVTNRGVNTNNVSLICRYTEDGWYEFNVANNGLYWIYAASVDSAGKIEYGLVYDGGSDKINYGKETNEYSIICKDNTLSLFINGTEVRTISETKYGLKSGKVGISVASFEVLPVIADLDWVTISEP